MDYDKVTHRAPRTRCHDKYLDFETNMKDSISEQNIH